jgi:tellurite resistance protein TehA-like permease
VDAALDRLRVAIGRTRPGSFAAVMATGIVSTAADRYHVHLVALALAATATAAYAWLCLAALGRIAFGGLGLAADWNHPRLVFSFLTFVAGSTVLGERLDELGWSGPALALVLVGIVSWAVLGYGVALRVMLRTDKTPPVAALDGGWMLWVVATQSLATATAMVAVHEPSVRQAAAIVAAAAWAAGSVLYLALVAMLMARLLLLDVAPRDVGPSYWVTMGATAITVLAGARLLNLPRALPVMAATAPTIAGVSFLLWAFGTWLVPLLAGMAVWRHAIHRTAMAYDPELWTFVFPLGMYAAASAELGGAERLPFATLVGGVAAFVAVIAWVAVAASWGVAAARSHTSPAAM